MSQATTPTTPRRDLPRALRPFGVAQYRVLVGALTLSLLGTGMWLVAVVWQVIELGGGPVQLSQVATGAATGAVAAVLFGGVLADRVSHRWILMGVEATKAALIGVAAWLSLTGSLELWHMVVLAVVVGATDGFFYPAYTAMLPTILPPEQLLAANGVEGMMRPALMQAAGPALASAAIAAASPGLALALVAASQVIAVVGLSQLRVARVHREVEAVGTHPLRAMVGDLREGVAYMVRTPWLLGTLLFACGWVLLMMGPIDVLLPFAVRDHAGGGPGDFALVLAGFGVGSAIGSLAVASWRLPRRYLTVLVASWSIGSVPLVAVGLTNQLWVMVAAVFVVGVTSGMGNVIWGTLLQRRVPPAMLGRVSSLDFFVSLLLMPVSMALAGPVGEAIGLRPVFMVASLVPVLFGLAVWVFARMAKDEVAHPLEASIPAVSESAPQQLDTHTRA
ncbi:MFS transporter [Georgenia yuyongxinii]|uniref:MFS transporter n=1 Tax=Georgenia yuyongxinii TaxID=2589797 RepID=A0A552WLS7_9MICO|nr:MFS transporter [Georgenia yuyongxinii]TRW43728.1 MFS transporter [Georgenia yuyongxinii]